MMKYISTRALRTKEELRYSCKKEYLFNVMKIVTARWGGKWHRAKTQCSFSGLSQFLDQHIHFKFKHAFISHS